MKCSDFFLFFCVFANSRYLRRFIVGDGGFLRWILAGAGRNRLVVRPRRRGGDRFNRIGQRGLNRLPQSVVGADPVRLVRFEVPHEFPEYAPLSVAGEQVCAVGVIGGECPTRVAGELSICGGIGGGCSVFVFHSWSARANFEVRTRTRSALIVLKEIWIEFWRIWRENAERLRWESENERGERKLGFLFGFGWEEEGTLSFWSLWSVLKALSRQYTVEREREREGFFIFHL